MSIQVNEGNHKFYIGDDAQAPDAEITYTFVDAHTIDVNHTFVDPSLRGHGVAKQLFNAVIKKAQEEDLKLFLLVLMCMLNLNEMHHLRI
ncbi:GNAT family N-acetyltransferase [Staphylococcus agnetis]|uniref:GNAT family N-acetyltransferase n=1 Tax=Staphylococcus agnetis TaxID=985762 RepID=UPI001F393472|nr:GNAT family N-acetyltransferase [Staphylococcus agnetis]